MEKAVRVIDSDPGREWTAEDINEVLSASLASVSAALSKAKTNELLNKCGRGRFRSKKTIAKPESADMEGTKRRRRRVHADIKEAPASVIRRNWLQPGTS